MRSPQGSLLAQADEGSLCIEVDDAIKIAEKIDI
jgi:hypothetical protein